MTHSNHRLGTRESLSKDYVVFTLASRGINDKGIGPKLQKFLRMGYKYGPVNAGASKVGGVFMSDPEKVVEEKMERGRSAYVVYDDKKKVEALLKDLVKADMGLSVVVSGLYDGVDEACQAAGIKRHTTLCSLGVWGKVKRLPPAEILDITTMCGHGMISFDLVRRMATEVKKGLISLEEAVHTLAKPCTCGIYNPKRAEDLLKLCIDAGIGE